ncbi:hypothetical protein J0910_19965 [Nocardiopsis sp. CNT-189]|uniref:hypothetical protein n=1 Tax=Nocardiopsis oceanisediminis TaxID=2816862 RepID=UPI003B2BBEA6
MQVGIAHRRPGSTGEAALLAPAVHAGLRPRVAHAVRERTGEQGFGAEERRLAAAIARTVPGAARVAVAGV